MKFDNDRKFTIIVKGINALVVSTSRFYASLSHTNSLTNNPDKSSVGE